MIHMYIYVQLTYRPTYSYTLYYDYETLHTVLIILLVNSVCSVIGVQVCTTMYTRINAQIILQPENG